MCGTAKTEVKVTTSVPGAIAVPTFKVGDKVKITRAVPSNYKGWVNTWVSEMNAAVGKTGVVSSILRQDKYDINVKVEGVKMSYSGGDYGYPSFVLEIVPEVAVPESKFGFTVGDKVEITSAYSGVKFGTVIGFLEYSAEPFDQFVQVKNDANGKVGGWYPKNVKKIAPAKPVETIDSLQTAPIVSHPSLGQSGGALATAKQIAINLGSKGQVTMDDVQFELTKQGFTSKDLGNAAGQVFKNSHFIPVGYTKSKRAGNNGRKITVWTYQA